MMPSNKILIVDDEEGVRHSTDLILKDAGFSTMEASTGSHAIEIFKKETPDTVLLDLKLPDMNGREVIRAIKRIDTDTPVIIMTGYGDITTAVELMKLGAYDFIVKPAKADRLVFTLQRAIEKAGLERSVTRLNDTVDASIEWVFGKSDMMKSVIGQIKQVAPSDFSVIIQGETGTGKSLMARMIHNLSRRAKKQFVAVDMGAMPETLVESELFGYEKGAFTGAGARKKGFFEIADGGTILIDEIENVSPYVQCKLLRIVEEKKVYPLGCVQPSEIDVRIIAATNINIKQAVEDNKFRSDLFYRLGEYIITIPPLRERDGDIASLAQKFVVEAGRELNKYAMEITDDAVDILKKYLWPGNVRELKNVIRRAVLKADGSIISSKHIEFLLIADKERNRNDLSEAFSHEKAVGVTIKDAEIKAIRHALAQTKGNKSKATMLLQISYTTLLRKMKQYGLDDGIAL